jgi:hypothetical protein
MVFDANFDLGLCIASHIIIARMLLITSTVAHQFLWVRCREDNLDIFRLSRILIGKSLGIYIIFWISASSKSLGVSL